MNELSEVARGLRTRIHGTWWMLLVQGTLALLIGSLLLTNTEASLRAFAPFLAIYWLVGGTLDILEGLTHRSGNDIWRWSAVGGALGIFAGLLLLGQILFGGEALSGWLALVIAVAAIASGAANILWAWRVRDQIEGEGWLILWGAVSIILGVWILGAPLIASEVWILLAAIFALVSGSGLVFWAAALATQHQVVTQGKTRFQKRLPAWMFVGGAIAVGIVAIGIWLFGQLELASAAPLGVSMSDAEQRGQQVFRLHCSPCHNTSTKTKYGPGLAGLFEPGGPILPRGLDYSGKLSNGKEITAANEFERIHTGGRGQIGTMPPVGMGLRDGEVNDVIAFLHLLKK